MPKTYEQASVQDYGLLAQAMTTYHPRLAEYEVKVALLMVASNGDAPALRAHGHAVAARIRVLGPRERLLAEKDAVIEVDADRWAELDEAQGLALLDHQLEHLIIQAGKSGEIKRGPDERPLLGTRPEDWLLAGFADVVERHGLAALEAQALRKLFDDRQGLFDFMQDKPPTKSGKRKTNHDQAAA